MLHWRTTQCCAQCWTTIMLLDWQNGYEKVIFNTKTGRKPNTTIIQLCPFMSKWWRDYFGFFTQRKHNTISALGSGRRWTTEDNKTSFYVSIEYDSPMNDFGLTSKCFNNNYYYYHHHFRVDKKDNHDHRLTLSSKNRCSQHDYKL